MQMQPHPVAVRAALLSDKSMPEFQDQIRNEANWSSEIFERYSREPHLADGCIVASSYTRKTLIENGVGADRIFTIPYGVNLEFFSPANVQADKFSVLFVGQLCRQKGLHYLLEAWRRLRLANAELRIVGHLPAAKELLPKYASVARFLGPLNWIALREEYRRADLLCLPSLSDGFGQAILEALACGTPILTTSSCGASDLIREGENGLKIPAADLESLITSLEWASQDRDKVRQMRPAARATAEQYPSTKFRRRIVEQLRSLTFHGR
jgi:glycosyltransferase involved in cell wall biosynthesis